MASLETEALRFEEQAVSLRATARADALLAAAALDRAAERLRAASEWIGILVK